jgi:hypothetical protein
MTLGSPKNRLQRRTQVGDTGFRREIIDVKSTSLTEADDTPVFAAQDGTSFRASTVNAKNKLFHEQNDLA